MIVDCWTQSPVSDNLLQGTSWEEVEKNNDNNVKRIEK